LQAYYACLNDHTNANKTSVKILDMTVREEPFRPIHL